MRGVVVAVVVLAAGAMVGGAVLQPGTNVVAGTARPLSGDALAKAIVARCPVDEVDLNKVRLGPLLRTSQGEYRAYATADDGMLIECPLSGGASTAGPYERAPEVRAMLAADGHYGGDLYVGYGWVAQEVARLDVLLPDGTPIKTQIRNEMFAFTGEGEGPGLKAKLRAYDDDGTVIYETD